MKTIIFCLSLFISPLVFAEDWGKTGHRVVAEIASNYLTEKTKIAETSAHVEQKRSK